MWIFYSRIQNFQSRFSRENKRHGLHSLVHSISLQIILLNISFLLKPPYLLPCGSNLPMQISALSGSLSSTISKISGQFVSPFFKQSLLCPTSPIFHPQDGSLPWTGEAIVTGSRFCTQPKKDPLVTRHCKRKRGNSTHGRK